MEDQYKFRDRSHLKCWLHNSDEGRDLLRELGISVTEAHVDRRGRVLAILHDDGYVEIRGTPNVVAHVMRDDQIRPVLWDECDHLKAAFTVEPVGLDGLSESERRVLELSNGRV